MRGEPGYLSMVVKVICRLGHNALLTTIPCIEGGDATPTMDPSGSTIEGGGSGTSVSAMIQNLLPLAGSSLGGCVRRRRGPTGPTEAGRTNSEGRICGNGGATPRVLVSPE